MNQSCETWSQPENPAPWELRKEPKLKLSLETRNRGDVIIVHCQGRIVYRDEASEFSRFVSEILRHAPKVILDFTGVTSMDSAGIGELALLHTKTQNDRASLKCAGFNPFVRNLLDLTNLDSVLEVHSSLEEALEAFCEDEVCTDC
jgi:anti-anti-sigma factor